MTHPALLLPFVSNPIGWAVLGTAGYLTYKAGKKAGLKNEDEIATENICDRAVKGAMKTVYKTKIKVEESLSSTRDKYSEMWNEAQTEVADNA